MVKLLLDIGNSACKCAEYAGDADSLTTYLPIRVDEHDIDSCIPVPAKDRKFDSVVVASVRSEAFNHHLAMRLFRKFDLHPTFVTTRSTACGVTIAYRYPEQLGVDRFFALLGAWRACGGACIVVDCGTAVTVDAIDGNGAHQGGMIMPGLRLLHKALGEGTAGLPMPDAADAKVPDGPFGRDTTGAIARGCLRMFGSGVVSAVQKMRAQLVSTATLFVTGGDAGVLLRQTGIVAEHRPYLVLEGLAVFSDHADACS